ncbi:DUF1800 family protein [Litorimonas sp. RW-G-Af-16]|uniref:DUF1800 domain-containing protein n=1 Tax=Litorimonas sp. RW-G-Af-16 TaxID=3241168 RepID=UPI00390C6ED6
MTSSAHHAMSRFGLGPSKVDSLRLGDTPKAWLHAQISSYNPAPAMLSDLPDSATVLAEQYKARKIKDEKRRKMKGKMRREVFTTAMEARTAQFIQSQTPFAERLVMFWSNHFTVSRTRGLIGPALPAYEREAIRPHIFGKFEDMLTAVAQHPCMLLYLDNVSSIGANSPQGQRRNRDLNENLAREILELHTLGVKGGYSQDDVTSFAKILTGWTVSRKVKASKKRSNAARYNPLGSFQFNANIHEPGTQTLLGQRYAQTGQAQGLAALRDLATHPSTATFIATKLVRHFVSDTPPADAVETIAAVFRKTGGDLAEVSKALIDLEAAWEKPLAKVKTPYDLMLSVMRAANISGPQEIPDSLFLNSLKTMGYEPFYAKSPAGWSDLSSDWVAPESLIHRIEWIRAFVGEAKISIEPPKLYEQTIAPVADPATQFMIEGAPSREDGLALIFASAAFQRR